MHSRAGRARDENVVVVVVVAVAVVVNVADACGDGTRKTNVARVSPARLRMHRAQCQGSRDRDQSLPVASERAEQVPTRKIYLGVSSTTKQFRSGSSVIRVSHDPAGGGQPSRGESVMRCSGRLPFDRVLVIRGASRPRRPLGRAVLQRSGLLKVFRGTRPALLDVSAATERMQKERTR